MKKITLIFSPFPSLFIFLWLYSCLYTHFVSCKCLDDQKSLLLELKNNLTFDPSALDKLEGWNQSTECCMWNGVKCDSSTGRVIGLDLSRKGIIWNIDNSSSLFRLQFLQKLDLSGNDMKQGEIPSALGKLTHLIYLKLSDSGFSGQVPIEISQLVKLNVLDISDCDGLYMKKPNLATIIRNLTNIRELYLDRVNNSAMGNKWCEALASSLPHLQVLSMQECDLRGEIHKSLSNLRNLSVIDLSFNDNLGGGVPEFLTQFTNLTELSLDGCDLIGTVPGKIFQMPTLRTLALSYNSNLQGTWPEFHKNGSLENLWLSGINFSTTLTSSMISNLKRLRSLGISNCQIHGSIPSSIGSLNLLEDLDLSSNQFEGPVPGKIFQMPTLRTLALSYNRNLQVTWPEFHKNGSLEYLSLSYCQFNGSISSSIGSLNQLDWLDLSNNQFEGPVPKSIFQLTKLRILDLSSNRLNGTLQLAEFLHSFKSLNTISLSYNNLSIETDGFGVNSSFPRLESLILGSCNLLTIPEFLQNQTSLLYLDLSMNNITGRVPRWIWGNTQFNLSFNHLVELEPPLTLSNNSQTVDFYSLDCSNNNLQGNFPIVSSNIDYLDCSNNNFTSIDPGIGNSLSKAYYFSFSKNNLFGSIPTSLCNATKLELLDLQHNHLGGTIPDCLTAMTKLNVLNLRGNKLAGVIPANFRTGCSLQTLDLNENFLQGKIPRSLAYCKELKVLDLGNNQLIDTFPCHLKSMPNLQVLILRSNKFHRTIICPESHSDWPLLQIVDLASNHFYGELRSQNLFKWKSMMTETTKQQSESSFLQSSGPRGVYYQNSVSLTLKGNTYELQNNLAIYTSIDFSNNAFHGELPAELGNLNALIVLNLSHNSFSGHIPSSIGNLRQIESLDLSCNAFSGKIPTQLANLYSLEYLNLSFNKLSGEIPTGTQLQSFNASSYEGNQGLYGPPLTLASRSELDPRTTPSASSQGSNWSSKRQIEWMLRGAEVGFPVGITVFVGPILYIKKYREWYCKHLHGLVMKILRKEDSAMERRRRRSRQRQRQRR